MSTNIASVIAIATRVVPGLMTISMAVSPHAQTSTQNAQAGTAWPAGTHWEVAGYVRGL